MSSPEERQGHCTRIPDIADPFRFLDLPKEIRLMVYERLPVKITHHGDEEFTLVHHTLPGVSIFTTCREIYDEARAILNPRLTTIKSQAIKLVAPTYGSRPLERFLGCLAATEKNCVSYKDFCEMVAFSYKDLCKIATKSHGTVCYEADHGTLDMPVNTPAQKVCLAVRISSGGSLEDRCINVISGFNDLYWDVSHIRDDPDRKRNLEIEHRLVLLHPDDKELSAEVESYGKNWHWREYFDDSQKYTPLLTRGAEIQEAEWEANWAEGEHFWPKL